MKPLKFFYFIILCVFSVKFSFAQGKNYAVKIYLPAASQSRANLLGLLEIDHFHEHEGSIRAEISEQIFERLRNSGARFEVLSDDIAADLQRKNAIYYEARNQGLINIDGTPTSIGLGRVAFEQPGQTVGNIIVTPSAFEVKTTLGGYYSFAEMNAAMDALVSNYPTLVQKISIGTSVEGRNLWCIKISDNVSTDENNEPEILYIGVQHARESIGGSSMIFFMQYLCERYAVDSRIKDIVDNREIFIIPCMNPDGWEYNRSIASGGGGMWRKNRRNNGGSFGVDLNRNWGVDWGNCSGASASCGSSSPSSDTYFGPSAFSEPETQAIRAFTKTRNFVAMIDQHAYGPYYSLPFGRPTLHTGSDNLTTAENQFYTNIPALMGKYNGMRAGNSPQSVGYEVAGGVKDWMLRGEIGVGTKGIVLGMTGEGGYGMTAGNETFWPPASQIVNLCKGIAFQNLQLLYAVGSYVDIQDISDIALSATSGSVSFRIKRIGQQNAPVTITAIPISNISFASPSIIVNSLPNYYDTYTGNIAYTLPVGITNGQRVQFAWRVQTSGYTYYDTITKFYNPTVLFTDNMETGTVTTNWTVTGGGWSYVVDSGYAATRALTESPGTAYPASTTRTIQYSNTLNLSDATAAFITFQVRHRAENFRDKLQLQVSPNGSTWTAVAGKTTVQEPGTLEGSTINGNPSLTGIKDDWVSEAFNLASYIGQPALRFRFQFTSDANNPFYAAQDAGFFIDNLNVIKSSAPLFTLAVNYISFTGKMLPSEEVLLEWQAEIDNDHSHFDVEKSADGLSFIKIGRVDANAPFNFTDRTPHKGNNYYRLKGVDINGKLEYSKIINVQNNPGLVLQVYPNPVKDELTVRLKSVSNPQQIYAAITDLSGRTVLQQYVGSTNLNSSFTVNCQSLKPQMYILKICNTLGEVLDIQKFVKQ